MSTPLNKNIYKDAVDKCNCAFAYHEAVFDENGSMTDYVFLDANTAFEMLTDLKKENIIGKRFVRDIIKDKEHGLLWAKKYEKVFTEGNTFEFEEFSEENKKFFSVKAFSPQKNQFVSLITDKTQEKKLQEIFKYLMDNMDNSIDYGKVTEFTTEITGADYAAFNLFDKNGLDFTTVAVRGITSKFKKLQNFLGFDIVNKKWPYDPIKDEKTRGKEITVFESLLDLTGNKLSQDTVLRIEKIFGLGIVAVAKIRKEGRDLGDFTLFFKKGGKLKNEELFLLYLSQLGLFIEKNRLNAELEASREMFYTLAEYAPVAFLSCDADGNITYANKKLLELMDSPSFETTKKINLLEFVNLQDCGFSQKLKDCMDNDMPANFEFSYMSLWGKFNWLKAYLTPVKEENIVTGANIVLDDITDKIKNEYDLTEKVYRDPLTKAYNRRALENKLPEKLEYIKGKGLIGCVAIIDIDNFKDINDNHGHKTGDCLLKYLATRVKKELRENDLLIRTGGDEFLIYLHDIRDEKNASKFIRRLFEKISGSYRMEDDDNRPYNLDVSCSVGVSFFPKHGTDIEALTAMADKALYKVKNSGKAAYLIEY